MHILALRRLHVCSIQGQIQFQELVGTIDIVEDVFGCVQENLCNRFLFDIDVLGTITVFRADRSLLRSVNLILIRSGFKREYHAFGARKDQTAAVRSNAVKTKAVFDPQTGRVGNLDYELPLHVANKDVADGRGND